ncbi:hypothetical protein O181_055800 [Austropuccinia psidii MF-1]|uniref:Uncharacterized protein n=1 Tax=Austropuccinia psidii MF-1 TaxID=1389203 RepID=A0A9Q3HVK6_9BASI|nr:hypothetical protein [Austropuccinia psidii MF-1]
MEWDASDKVLIDTGASIHLSGTVHFATCTCSVFPFCIFFANSNSSVLISHMTTLKLPVSGGLVLVHVVEFSDKILGTILSVGRLCTAGVVPVFDDLELSLFVCDFLVTTTFNNNCWWLDILAEEGTGRSAAASPACVLSKIEMPLISKPASMSLSSRKWHERLGHLFSEAITLTPSSGSLFTVRLLLSTNGPRPRFHLQHGLPSGSSLQRPQCSVGCDSAVPSSALWTHNAKESTLASFILSLSKLGIGFFPSLPYSPQENGEAEPLNQTLGNDGRKQDA